MTYRDPSRPIEDRVADLLARMTPEEKVAQLGSVLATDLLGPDGLDEDLVAKHVHHGVGQVTRLAGRTALPRAAVADAANRIQAHLLEQSRLGIPAVFHEECLAGFMAVDAVMFPQALALAAGFDPDLAHRLGHSIGSQMRLAGAHFGLAPVLDIARDPRWGRIEETLGEDPHLTSVLGLAMVEGLQHDNDGSGIIATAKHFVGHGVPEGGRNAASPHIPPRELAEVFMAPFEQVVRHGRVGAVMHAYHDLDGVPCIANRWLLTDLLREEWGFDGIVVSDYNGVEELHSAHRVAADLGAAAKITLEAGLDVELPETSGFGDPLLGALRTGEVSGALVDQAVTRVLTQKFALGLFEDPFIETGRVAAADPAAQDLALEAALAGIVLLENAEQVLPLAGGARVALIGPNADDPRGLVGDYGHVAHQELLNEQRNAVDPIDGVVPDHLRLRTELFGVGSIREALVTDGLDVHYAKGCEINSDDRSGFDQAVATAAACDIALMVMGERSGLTPECTIGESRDRIAIGLPGVQQALLEAVAATGTPVVLLMVGGRVNSVPWAVEHAAATLWTAPPGHAGGAAVSAVLTGAAEPRGRLPVTVARDVGQIPIHYGHNPSSFRSRWRDDYVEESHRPLWPFGHGLGYTSFTIDDVSGTEHAPTDGDAVELAVEVANTGDRAGSTVVQIYVEQAAASVVRPARRLVWFDRVELDAGESTTVPAAVPVGRFALVNQEFVRGVEPGRVVLAVGESSAAISHRHEVELTGSFHRVDSPPPAR